MITIDEVIELLYKAKGVDNSEVINIANDINNLYMSASKDVSNVIEDNIYSRFGYNFTQLQIRCRMTKFIIPRQIAMWLLNEYNTYKDTEESFKMIGKTLSRSRVSVRSSVNVINNRISTEQEFKKLINSIKSSIDEQL